MKEDKITVLRIAPGGKPEAVEIDNTLKSMQKLVGGYIEAHNWFDDVAIVCNEEGLIRQLPYNRKVLGNDFFGTIFFAGISGEEFCSLTLRQIDTIINYIL